MEGSGLGLLLVPDSRFRDATAATVRAAAVDGFVVYSAVANDPRVEAALERRLPVVTVDQPRDLPTAYVGIDDRAAARAAAVYLRELGHTRVGVLSFVAALDAEGTHGFFLSTERLAGYQEGLAELWDADAVRVCRPNALRPARRAALDLLGSESPPTAILAMSDVLARGAAHAAAELGVAVPRELSIVGFDDSPAATLGSPALTTVAQPHGEKGRVVGQWLVEAIEGSRPLEADRRVILPTELVVRESTAPPQRV
jgi:DNA-binding LacI/PurR family transcriptional regulator